MANPSPKPLLAVIITVRDEATSIERLLDSLAAQTRPPDEVVVVDGGSSDGTVARLRDRAMRGDLPLRVLERPGANISAGRNAALREARAELIAATDAGVRLEPEWLARLAAPLAGSARVAAGFFASDPSGAFETALGATTLPEARDVDPDRFLPSSRSVAFVRTDALAVGGYPEWLDYCEDLVFDLRLLAVAGAPTFVPDAVARFRPRADLAAFLRQYYRYARGDGKADLWRARHAIRYATYLGLVPALALLTARHHPAWGLALLGGLAAMVRTPYRRLVGQWAALDGPRRLAAVAWVPIVRVAGDLAKMAGYPVGVAWRLRQRPPDWRPAAKPDAGRW